MNKIQTVAARQSNATQLSPVRFMLLLTLACAALLLGSAAAQAQPDMSRWDANGDKRVSLAEWDTGVEMENVFDNIDKNDNDLFDVDEAILPHFSFSLDYDYDKGGFIERPEFILGIFERLDTNGNNILEEQEFTVLGRTPDSAALFDPTTKENRGPTWLVP